MDLNELRNKIDGVDDGLVELLSQRSSLVRQAAQIKRREDLPLRSVEREESILGRLLEQATASGIDKDLIERVYGEILDSSIHSQWLALGIQTRGTKSVSVVYQGAENAYSHQASRNFFSGLSPAPALAGCTSFQQVVRAVTEGSADYGVLPIENSNAGSLTEVYDLLVESPVAIIGEEILEIDHCLIGLHTAELGKIQSVLSHWQALAQCREFLKGFGEGVSQPFEDTSLAVARVKELGDPTVTAIASAEAAQHYGLRIIQRGIADRAENFTRFVVVAKRPLSFDTSLAGKTSIVIGTEDRPGALYRALTVIDRLGVNLSKLESRPRKGSRFEYLFFLDLEGSSGEEGVRSALEELAEYTSFLQVLGSYPAYSQTRKPRLLEARKPHPGLGRSSTRGGSGLPTGVSSEYTSAFSPGAECSYRLVGRGNRTANTVVRIGEVEIGGDDFVVIAGPCAVESEEQIRECARWARSQRVSLLRGGCFKPRTSPYSFQGLGHQGLELLAAAGREYGLAVVTEVMRPEEVALVYKYADVLQIGARNMQNFPLLTAVGQVDKPVLLKRGLAATLDEFLNAAEYILAEGNQQVILCERGIRTFETITRSTLDLAAVPILRCLTHLPIIVDPSHAAGRRDLVIPLALAARAVGPDGLMIEMHPRPEEALSDGRQSLCFEEFAMLMNELDRAGDG